MLADDVNADWLGSTSMYYRVTCVVAGELSAVHFSHKYTAQENRRTLLRHSDSPHYIGIWTLPWILQKRHVLFSVLYFFIWHHIGWYAQLLMILILILWFLKLFVLVRCTLRAVLSSLRDWKIKHFSGNFSMWFYQKMVSNMIYIKETGLFNIELILI